MEKTKLVPITSLDQLEVGSICVNLWKERFKILSKCGLIVWLSYPDDYGVTGECLASEELLKKKLYVEVPEEPWVPKEGEMYYCPWVGNGKAETDWNNWGGERKVCRAHLITNLVCKTEEEALAKAQKMLDSIKDSE